MPVFNRFVSRGIDEERIFRALTELKNLYRRVYLFSDSRYHSFGVRLNY